MERIFKTLKNHFIPHGGNDYKPHFLRHKSMLFVCFLTIIIELLFLVQVFIVFNKTNFLANVLPAVLTLLTNEERGKNNVAPLLQNDLLQKAAQLKADNMAAREYFSHTDPDGKLPWHYFDLVGYNYSYAGENLAVNFFDSKDVAEAWMNSPTHRANIVKKDFTQIGIGVANGIFEGKNSVFVVEFFGTPSQITPEKITTNIKKVVQEKAVVSTTPKVSIGTKVLDETTIALKKIITSPRQSVAYVYGGIALLIVLSLILVFFIKSEIKHPLIMWRGLVLMAIIILLLFVNIRVSHLEISTNDATANTVAY